MGIYAQNTVDGINNIRPYHRDFVDNDQFYLFQQLTMWLGVFENS